MSRQISGFPAALLQASAGLAGGALLPSAL